MNRLKTWWHELDQATFDEAMNKKLVPWYKIAVRFIKSPAEGKRSFLVRMSGGKYHFYPD